MAAKVQYGTVIHPDGSHEEILPGDGKKFTLEELQRAVGGYIEVVHLKPGLGRGTAYVNEEGKLQSPPLARNPKASDMVRLAEGDYVSGNLVLVRVRPVAGKP